MESETRVKLAVYHYFAETASAPSVKEIAVRTGLDGDKVLETYGRLAEKRVLVLEENGSSIRMAPPFSGVPSQHVVEAGERLYYANCAWDALGVVAALATPAAHTPPKVVNLPATIHSRCEQTGDPLNLKVGAGGPETSDWLFHSLVPAAKWWDDIVFT